MTQTLATTTTSTFVGFTAKATKPIGIISYNTTTGQVKQCEVYSTFWEGKTPTEVDLIHFLFSKGYGLIRLNTLKFSSLV